MTKQELIKLIRKEGLVSVAEALYATIDESQDGYLTEDALQLADDLHEELVKIERRCGAEILVANCMRRCTLEEEHEGEEHRALFETHTKMNSTCSITSVVTWKERA